MNKIAHRHSHKISTAKSSKENPAAITTGFVSSLRRPVYRAAFFMRNNLTRVATPLGCAAAFEIARGAPAPRPAWGLAGLPLLPPLKTRFSPRLARALFMPVLMQ